MPRYYFNIFDDALSIDRQGAYLANECAARAHAVRTVRRLSAELAQDRPSAGHYFVEYVDAAQKKLGAVRFDEDVGNAF